MTKTWLQQLYDPKLERNVLAAMLVDPDLADAIVPELAADDFWAGDNRQLYQAISQLWHNGEPLDTYGIVDEMRYIGADMDDAEVLGFVAGLMAQDYTVTATGRHHAGRLLTYSRLRKRVQLAQFIVDKAYSGMSPEDLDAAIDEKMRELALVRRDSSWLYGWETQDWHDQVLRRYQQEAAEGKLDRFDWPWESWNQRIPPQKAGLVYMLAALAGIGKTAYLDAIAEHWARRGSQVVNVHLEDDHEYKLNRRLAHYAKIPLAVVESGTFEPAQQQRKHDAEETIGEWSHRLHYLHANGWTAKQVVREITARRQEGVCDAVVLDYIDKLRADRRQARLYGDNTWERQADDVEIIKNMAEDLSIPVFTASQLNKSGHSERMKTGASVQGSGQKRHKSQLLLMVDRELVGAGGQRDRDGNLIAQEGEYSPIVDLRIDKQNRGGTGMWKQYFRGDCFLVVDLKEQEKIT